MPAFILLDMIVKMSLFFFLSCLQLLRPEPLPVVYATIQSQVTFVSEAPLELIQAETTALNGLLDTQKNSFAFSIDMLSFSGFNSPLQREHFNENYLESSKYPKATFSGKIIESVDLTQAGTYDLRAKGMLNIHGVAQERILRIQLQSDGDELQVTASFFVLLEDHDIRIPKVVYQKIAEEIQIKMEASFAARP
jgi:polyisoprenoid-binding protein YceI